jgi:TolB-like protein/Flp pilus assembly protein TadD
MAAGAWYMFSANRPATEAPNAAALSASLSIVVLPFANLSGDASQDYVADAIGEELTTALSRLKNSFVIARTTALTYKGKSVDVKQIGKELGVRYALEGSAQRVGDRVRVTAQLIDAETGAHLWADQFDQPRADLLEMQDDIVTRLGRALDLQLTEADVARNQRLRPGNLDAEDLALRCRSEWQQFFYDAAKVQAAYGLCDQALKLDERNVTALGMLAFKWILPVLFLKSADPASDIRQAGDFVSSALAVDPEDPMAHLVRAWIFGSQGNFEAQQVEAERIISTNPSDILAYIAECNAFNQLGRAEEAIECSDKALRLSPRDPFASDFLFQKGFAQLLLDRYDQSIVSIRRALALTPTSLLYVDQLAYNIIAQVAAGQSLDRDAAIREVDTLASQSLAANQNDFFARFVKSLVLIQQNHLLEAITEMERIPPGIRLIYFVYHAACDANAHLGRADQTIECADKVIALGTQFQNLHQAHFDKGWALLMQNKNEGAIESFRRSIAIRPTASMTQAFLAAALGATGHEVEARDELKQYLSMPGVRLKTLALWQDYWNHWPSDYPAVLDFRKRFFDGLRKAGLPEE